LAALVVASVFVQNFWCRYLCPYGALTGLAGMLSPLKVRRNTTSCIDCGKCTRACPSQLPVAKLIQIRSAECTGCLECVATCPVESTLEFTCKPEWVAAAICVIFFGAVAVAMVTGHWSGDVPLQAYQKLVPMAQDFSH
jgi:polyferredoxin